jgi:hypothetical protein
VTYPGLYPPTDLFADLELIGWTPPTPAPPPHEAIDWSRPNEATGQRFTLRDYTVDAAVVQPPPGTAARGRWTDVERSTQLAALGRVLRRHPDVVVDDPTHLVAATGTGAAPDPAAVLVEPSAPPAGAAAPPPPHAAPPPPGSDVARARVVVLADPLTVDAVVAAVRALGIGDATATGTTRVATSTYRGSTSEREVPTVRIEAVVPEPDATRVATHLAEAARLRLTAADRVWIVALGPAGTSDGTDLGLRPGPVPGAVGPAPAPGVAAPPPSAPLPAAPGPLPSPTVAPAAGGLHRRPPSTGAHGLRGAPAFVDHAR